MKTMNTASVISPSAQIGNNVTIGNFCTIYDNVEIHDNAVIEAYCTIGSPNPKSDEPLIIGYNSLVMSYSVIRGGTIIGKDVIIHPHVVIEKGITIGKGIEIFPGSYIGTFPNKERRKPITVKKMMVKAIKQNGGLFIPNIPYIKIDKNNCVLLKIKIEDDLSHNETEEYSFQSLDDILEITKDIKGDIDEDVLKDVYFSERLQYENFL